MSTTDGQNFENPVHPSDDTQPQQAVNVVEEVAGQQSRRKFLRTAVISGVAVATVGTTAGVAAAAANPHPGVLKRLGINLGRLSAQASCTMCFEDTDFNSLASTGFNVNHNNGNASPGSFYIWFTAQHVPDGSYTISISPDPGAAPFKYQANPNGNAAFLYQYADGTAQSPCPTFSGNPPQLPGGEQRHAGTLAGLFQSPYASTYTVSGGPVDLQIAAHIKWDGTILNADTVYTFTGTLKDSLGNTVCTAQVSVTAHNKTH